MTESLHEAAMRVTGKRGCDGCCTCKNGAGSPCEFNDLRNSDGACLIRRIAQINNADEQIEWLKKWQKENPPKPHWIQEKDGIDNIWSCSECGKRVYVTTDYDLPNYLKNYCPNCGTRLDGERKCN